MQSRTEYSESEITEKIVGEWYVRKNEAIEKGIAHDVVHSLRDIF